MPYKGSTLRLKNTLTDYDGSALDPDSQEVRIYDSNGTEVSGSPFTPTKESAGVYYVDYTIPADGKEGTWKVKWKAVKGTKPNIDAFTFNVSAP